ncbi:hypothetical protein [Serpentinicella alkaliphila]|uniref:Uncharacterized protein n=1 Tax=Serpentinicella alkaliphila TaxID=1734049 RepID=A0A4R2TGM3_9FIRM|nr:hypothetical protein [Serpentinicella alkaliphila]QUH24890.1 hypothetical protein HZR23_03185 [Serpentinicella alkaliphila]TCQ01836.1 hypothetical protein EDD79_102234 [Serpentinicella alkaliphila]
MIDPMPLNFHLLCLVPEAFLTITLGTMFIGINVKWSKTLITSLAQSMFMYILVVNYNIDIIAIYNYITLVICTILIMRIGIKNSIISIGFAMAIGILLKGTSTLVLLSITDISVIEIYLKNWVRFIFLIPYFLELLLIIILVRKYRFNLEPRLNL